MLDHGGTSVSNYDTGERTPLAALREFARPRARPEKCALCGSSLWPQHPHLIDLKSRRLVCSCDACAILFSGGDAAAYRRVPQRTESLPGFQLSDAQWDSLLIPIGLAFFFQNTTAGRVVAVYPSPAGAMESPLRLDAWQSLVEENPVLGQLQPDVEALLVDRLGDVREYYRVPIDECYRLIGLIRVHWRGLSGGTEVWDAVGKFFKHLQEKSCST
jgi:hypothetical protein